MRNKRISRDKCRHWGDRLRGLSFSPLHLTDPLESIRLKKFGQNLFHLPLRFLFRNREFEFRSPVNASCTKGAPACAKAPTGMPEP